MEIRPYQGSDEAALLAVWGAAMTHDRLSADQFRTRVLLDPNFQPDNLPLAVVDGRVAGFALALTRQVPLFLQGLEPDKAWITAFGVHPDHRRQGIGRALFTYLFDKLRSENRRQLDISPYVPNYFVPGVDTNAYPGTVAFLEQALGFRTLYQAISMGADLTGFQVPPEIAILEQRLEREQGVTVRPVTPADLPDLMPFIVRHFGWDWYRHAQDYLLEIFGDTPNNTCFLVARQHGEVIGYCQQRRERFGPFGVNPERRNLGVGRVLLFRCLEAMSARHVFYAYFLWTGEDAARLYTLAGFRRRRAFAVLRKDL
jgi:ribosomal protein S18 acetylase RimI-like enzyme